MSLYALNQELGQRIQSDVPSVNPPIGNIANFQVEAAKATAGTTTAITALFATSTATTVVTTGITNPTTPRNITATTDGTAGDIKAVQVIIEGTNYLDEVITETLPVFTVDTKTTVIGNKAFKTITKITVPAMDGAGATVSIGVGEKLGLPYKLSHNTVMFAFLNLTREATAPTVTVSATAIESNTIDLNSALNGTVVNAYLIV